MKPPLVEAGFDYRRTVLELRVVKTYEQIAEFCGYASSASVARIAAGTQVPAHPQGEALWIMYWELFNRKPPLIPQTERLAIPSSV